MKRHSKSSSFSGKAFNALIESSVTPTNKGKIKNANQQNTHISSADDLRDDNHNHIKAANTVERRDGYVDTKENGHAGKRGDIGISASNSSNSSSNTSIAIRVPPLYKECLNLYKAKQYRSAELLAMYNITSLAPNSMFKAHALELVADCAFHQDQFARAGSFYKQAFDYCCHESSSSNNPLFFSSISNAAVSSSFQAQLKHKESTCLLKSGNVLEASNLLESFIPIRSPFRTYAISMDLGRMYLTTGRQNDARRCFIDVLNKNIYALEAVECLAQMGTEKSAVSKIVHQKLSSMQQSMTSTADKTSELKENSTMNTMTKRTQRASFYIPMNDIVNATFYSHRGSSHALHAWNYWSKLLDQYPNHTYLLLQMAILQDKYPFLLDTVIELNTNSSSFHGGNSSIFAKIRDVDPCFMDGMDIYAYRLAKHRNNSELSRLCSDLLEMNDKRHEAWVALALHHHTSGDVDKSLAFLEKAISNNPRSAFCHQLMGRILQSEGRLDHSILSYFRANEITKDVICYEGLVEAYLSCSKYKEAVVTAKEAINFAPRDPRAMTLVGLALMSAPGSRERGREKAKRTLKKAFNSDPTNKKALFALVDLHLEEDEFDVCIEFIKTSIDESDGCATNSQNPYNGIDQLYSKLSEVYIAQRRYGNALECFHKALSLNPSSLDAKLGMEELEKVMKYDVDVVGASATRTTRTTRTNNNPESDDDEYNNTNASYHGRQSQHESQHQHRHNYTTRYDPVELDSVVRAI